MELPKELEGKAFINSRGNIKYLECISCGKEKNTRFSQKSSFCGPCGIALKRWNNKELNQSEGYRICRTCEIEKPLTKEYFDYQRTVNNWLGSCKECVRQKGRERYNSKKYKEYSQRPEVIKQRRKRRKERMDTEPEYKLASNVRRSINQALRSQNGGKNGNRTFDKLPYSVAELKEHLESQFDETMSWDNWGKGEGCWNIDHIYPQSKLPYDSLEHPNFLECWKLENLRPLAAIDNIKKGDKIEDLDE